MFEGARVREHVFERRSALKGAARTSPAKAGRGAKYTEFSKRRVSSAIYFWVRYPPEFPARPRYAPPSIPPSIPSVFLIFLISLDFPL